MFEDTKVALIEGAINLKKVNRKQVLQGMEEGLIKKISNYVRSKKEMPSFEWAMSEYNDNTKFQLVLARIDVQRSDVEILVNQLLGRGAKDYSVVEHYHPLTQGRNETCACGSGKKYKKCCGV